MFAALVSRYVVKKNGFDHFYTEVREYTCKHSVLKTERNRGNEFKVSTPISYINHQNNQVFLYYL